MPEQQENEPVNRPQPWWVFMSRIVIGLTVLVILLLYPCYLQVSQSTAVVVTRFGKPIRVIQEPGPYLKLPWPIDEARVIDIRQNCFNTPYTATLTRDRRNVVLSTFVVWKVEDPLLFLQSAGSVQAVSTKLDGMITAAKNTRMGGYDLSALVSVNPGEVQTTTIEQQLLADVQQSALEKFGIHIQQVGINRIAYESTNVAAVLAQMKAERESAAKQLRAFGEKEASAIRDDAIVKSEEILRDGRLEAGRIRADAEREVSEIYALAHSVDPEFYRYWRSLEALKRSLGNQSTVILRTDQGVFNLLTDPPPAPKHEPSNQSATTMTIRSGKSTGPTP